jgi:TonB family protein
MTHYDRGDDSYSAEAGNSYFEKPKDSKAERPLALLVQFVCEHAGGQTKVRTLDEENAAARPVHLSNPPPPIETPAERPPGEVDLAFRGASEEFANIGGRRGLEGNVNVSLTIAPTGEVTNADIISSQINSADAEASIIWVVKRMKFSPENVVPLTVTRKINFALQ